MLGSIRSLEGQKPRVHTRMSSDARVGAPFSKNLYLMGIRDMNLGIWTPAFWLQKQ